MQHFLQPNFYNKSEHIYIQTTTEKVTLFHQVLFNLLNFARYSITTVLKESDPILLL